MTEKRRGRFVKRLLKAAAVLLLFLVLLLITYPVWLPWVASPLARRYGATWGHLERKGYSRFLFRNLVYTNKNLEVTAGSVETLSPATWAWNLRKGEGTQPFASVHDWVVKLPAKAQPSPEVPYVSPLAQPTNASVLRPPPNIVGEVERLQKLLPSAVLTNGRVAVGQFNLQVPWLALKSGEIRGEAFSHAQTNSVVQFSLKAARLPYQLEVTNQYYEVAADALITTNSDGYFVEGTLFAATNLAGFNAQIPPALRLPDWANLAATNIALPRHVFALPGFAQPVADLQATWKENRFEVGISGHMDPLRPQDGSPLEFSVGANGSTNRFALSRFELKSDWFNSALARPVQIVPHQPWLLDPAQVSATADLGKQNAIPVGGRIALNLFVTPAPGKWPSARFFGRGRDFSYQKWRLSRIDTEGSFEWPIVRLNRFVSEAWPASILEMNGSLNVSNRVLESATFNVASGQAPEALTNLLHWGSLTIAGSAQGAIDKLNHQGRIVSSDLAIRGGTSLDAVELGWNGRTGIFETLRLGILQQQTGLGLDGNVSILTNGVSAMLRGLAITNKGGTLLALAAPVSFKATRAQGATNWDTTIQDLKLTGKAGELDLSGGVQWPSQGKLTFSGGNISPQIVRDFVPVKMPEVFVKTIQGWAAWTNSPVRFELATAVESTDTNVPFTLEARLGSDGQRVQIGYAALVQSNSPIMVVSGSVPMSLTPGKSGPVVFDFAGPLRLHASAQSHPYVLDKLTAATGWQIREPELLMDVEGTWRNPKGVAQLNVAKIIPKGKGTNLPSIGPVSAVVEAGRERIYVRKLEARVQDQPVSIRGEVPLFPRRSDKSLASLLDLTNASGAIVIERGAVAAWKPLAPKILGPEGEFSVDLAVRPGMQLFGTLIISGARTENISTLGAIRDISMRLAFSNNVAYLESARARIGGAPVLLSGKAELAMTNLFSVPPFSIKASGREVPLSRQPDAIIRADVDVVVTKTNGAAPIIVGEARMRDSYFLSDLASLVPGKVANPRERPPYFSIDDPPLDSMRLNIAVSGTRGMRVRTPYLAGEISPNIQLTGTLKNPVAVGDVRVDSGFVRFPFGSLEIQQGLVSASRQDPTHPQLSVNAASRQYGYDIRLDVSGTATEPILQFSSIPPLSSDQILMMMTAGELPRGHNTLTPGQRAQTFAMFLGRDLLAKLGMGDSANDRFVIRSGTEFSEEGKPTYDIEFKLDNRWSLTGEYDRFGDYNAGVKWRVYSK